MYSASDEKRPIEERLTQQKQIIFIKSINNLPKPKGFNLIAILTISFFLTMKNRKYIVQSMIGAAMLLLAASCKKEDILQEKLTTDNNLAVTATGIGREFTLVPDVNGRLVIDNSNK